MNILPNIRELITTFMCEAKSKHDINSGTHPEYNWAVGLVETSICFEALSNSLMPSEQDLKAKRCNFSSEYQDLFKNQKEVFNNWIKALKEKLDKGSLKDMTPNSRRADLEITNPENLSQIIEIIYRVRSNLVHGSKDLKEERSRVLIENSFRILYNLLDLIFDKEGIKSW